MGSWRQAQGRAWCSESISQCIWWQQPSSPAAQQPSTKAGNQGALQICSFCGTDVPLWMHECPESGLLPAEVLPETGASSLRGRGIWGRDVGYHPAWALHMYSVCFPRLNFLCALQGWALLVVKAGAVESAASA